MKRSFWPVLMILCILASLFSMHAAAVNDEPLYYREVEWDREEQDWGDPGELRVLEGWKLPPEWNRTLVFCDADGSTLKGTPVLEKTGVFDLEQSHGVDDGWLIAGVTCGDTRIFLIDGNVTYSASVSCVTEDEYLGQPDIGGDPVLTDECACREFEYGGKDYAAGFGFERDDVLDLYNEHMSGPSVSYELTEGEGYGEHYFEYGVYLAEVIGTEGINTIYRKSEDLEMTVDSLTLDSFTGDAGTFSLEAGSAQVTTAVSPESSGRLYYDTGCAGSARLTAALSVGEEHFEVYVTFTCKELGTDIIDCSEADTIQEIYDILARESGARRMNRAVVVLGAKTYAAGADGVTAVTLPDVTFCSEPVAVTLCGTEENGIRTVVIGTVFIDTQAGGHIQGISFEAPVRGEGTALCGRNGAGAYNVIDCAFEGYETAIDCSDSFIGATKGNVFTDNTTAIRVALPAFNCNQDQWRFNRFIKNETAIKVEKLNSFITPYYFRVCDSDFMCNGVDFDLQIPGTFYFYRNFFFCADEGGIRAPVIINSGTSGGAQDAGGENALHCYPARANSITDDDDTLIFGNENTVLNSIADELVVQDVEDGTAITVVEDTGSGPSQIAQWQF